MIFRTENGKAEDIKKKDSPKNSGTGWTSRNDRGKDYRKAKRD
jgi:hypothetical protein